MKKWNAYLIAVLAVVMSSLCCQSCLDDDDDNYSYLLPNALVTVKSAEDGAVYFQLDDSTTLAPENISSAYFKREVRALVNFDFVDEREDFKGPGDLIPVHVNRIDSILTKKAHLSQGAEEDAELYGSNRIEIIKDWMNGCEDGYLTLHVSFLAGGGGVTHALNLATSIDKDGLYHARLYHNANNDADAFWVSAAVAFKIEDLLPLLPGEKKQIELTWDSYDGEKSHIFKYRLPKEKVN